MKELFLAVPKISLLALANQNAEFVNFSSRNKDCYLLFESDNNQDCWHGEHTFRCKNSLDTSYVSHCELCYECTDCHTCYNVKFSQDCHQCSDSWFLDNCASCQHCYACANLHNKKFCFWNEQYTKEEYQQKIADLNLGGYQIITQQKEKFANFCKTVPHKFMHGVHNEQAIGDYLQECKNAFFCFDGKRLEDCKYVSDCEKTKMTHDVVVF